MGKSQKEMAESFSIPQTTWSNYEVGKASPPMGILISLADQGYPIKGLTTGLLDDMAERTGVSKAELKKRLAFARAMAEKFPEDTPIDDAWAKKVDDGYRQHMVENTVTEGLGKFVRDTAKAISEHDSRLAALEASIEELRSLKHASQAEYRYPTEVVDTSGLVAETEPGYDLRYWDDIAAGPPVRQTPDQWEMVVKVPRRFVKTKDEDYFTMRVSGNSMIDALIPDGSLILLRWSDAPKHGRIQAVWIDEGTTLKRMEESEDHGWRLLYEDGTGRTIPLGEDSHVVGDFVAVLPPHTGLYAERRGVDYERKKLDC